MNEIELRKIIALILEAIKEVTTPKRVLVLFTGALICCAEGGEALKRLAAAGIELEYVQTTAAKKVLNQDKIRALGIREAGPHLIANNDALVIPTLTVNTVAKAAHGIADSLATNLISKFLMNGKSVIAATNAADPDSVQKRQFFPKMPPSQAALLRKNLALFADLGVRLSDVYDLDKAVLKALGVSVAPVSSHDESNVEGSCCEPPGVLECPARLISAQFIQGLPVGTTLRVSQGAVITAFAQDLARNRSIRVERA